MKLKTLKDIYPDYWDVMKIRTEAIKWVKAIRETPDKIEKAFGFQWGCEDCGANCSIEGELRHVCANEDFLIWWIKHLFNITEEDLK